jgi:hypothetical protein
MISGIMGRDLEWHVIKVDNWTHDHTKRFCFEWDVQPDEEDVKEEVFLKVNDEQVKWYTCMDDHNRVNWCPVCLTYAMGLWYSPYRITGKHIAHSYSNPIWGSEWNVRNFYLGSTCTSFIRQFRQNSMYSEVRTSDVSYSHTKLHVLGEPKRTSDKEAYHETLEVLKFLEYWTSQPGVIVVFEDEF